jgi:transcriptional regulator with XRE-family HTH domain
MRQDDRTSPTIRLRDGADERLKSEFKVAKDTDLAELLGVDPSHYSRVKNGRSDPGPYFQARLLTAIRPLDLDWYDVFEVAPASKNAA